MKLELASTKVGLLTNFDYFFLNDVNICLTLTLTFPQIVNQSCFFRWFGASNKQAYGNFKRFDFHSVFSAPSIKFKGIKTSCKMSHSSLCGTMEVIVNLLACYCLLLHWWKTDHRRTELRCTIINHAKVNHTLTSGVWDRIRTNAIAMFSCWQNAPRCFEFTPAFSHRVWPCIWNHRKICLVRGTLSLVVASFYASRVMNE